MCDFLLTIIWGEWLGEGWKKGRVFDEAKRGRLQLVRREYERQEWVRRQWVRWEYERREWVRREYERRQ